MSGAQLKSTESVLVRGCVDEGSVLEKLLAVVEKLSERVAGLEGVRAEESGGAVGGAGSVGDVGTAGDVFKEKEKEKQTVVGSVVESCVGVVDVDEGSDSGVSVASSWADLVEAEIGDGNVVGGGSVEDVRVEMPVGKPVVSGVVKTVKFGGVVDIVGVPAGTMTKGFFAEYVRTPRVRALMELLFSKLGVRMPKGSMEELALASFAVGSVPSAFRDGQARVRALATIGDSVLATVLVADAYVQGQGVAKQSQLKSTVLSNAVMGRALVASGLAKHLVYPAGVSLVSGRVGADFLEAFAGVLFLWRDISVVKAYMRWMQLIG